MIMGRPSHDRFPVNAIMERKESYDSDESGGVGNMVHLSVNDSVRDTAPGKPGLMGRMFRRVGARGAPN